MSKKTKTKRLNMVQEQLAGRGIRDKAVLRAMAEVPRHHFVPAQYAELAYEDTPLPIASGQTISQPYIVARMIESLRLKSGHKVLEVGTGSGYAAAVMSRIAGTVYTIERHERLALTAGEKLAALNYDNVFVRHGDGTLGWPEHAPYKAIKVAAGGPNVPQALLTQMALDGRLVIPVGEHPRTQRLVRVHRLGTDQYEHEALGGVRFVPLVGEAGWGEETTVEAARS